MEKNSNSPKNLHVDHLIKGLASPENLDTCLEFAAKNYDPVLIGDERYGVKQGFLLHGVANAKVGVKGVPTPNPLTL